MNAMPTAAAGKIGAGGDLRVDRHGLGAMRITGSWIWGDPADRPGRTLGRPEPMITAKTVNGIVRFQARREELLRRLGQPVRTNGSRS